MPLTLSKCSAIITALLFISFTATAQMEVFEKEHGISRKARKGYLGQIEVDQQSNMFDLIYVLKTPSSKIAVEHYYFDQNLNLVKTTKEEEEVERVKTKYKWFRFKGETYESKSLYVRRNLKGEMVFREKIIKYKWSWFRGGYAKRVILGEKVKPRDEASGKRYMFYGGYYENDPNGYILVAAGVPTNNNPLTSYLNYQIIQADGQVNITRKFDISFATAKAPIFSEPLDDDDPSSSDDLQRDWILIFAPYGGPGMGKMEGDPKVYTYCRISPTGELKEKYDFQVPVAGWRILGAFQRDGEVYLYGPGIDKDKNNNEIFKGPILANTSNDDTEDKKSLLGGFKGIGGEGTQVTQDDIDARLDELKYTNFQVGKLNGGKLEFIDAPTIDAINKVNRKPEGQKKEVEFDGKRFITTGIGVTSTKDIFVHGQDYKLDRLGGNKGSRLYKGLFMMQYGADGKLKSNYGVELDRKKGLGQFSSGLTSDMYPAQSSIFESPDGQKLYWMISMCKAIDTDTDIDSDYNFFSGTRTTTVTTRYSPLFTIQYGVIDAKNNSASDFKTLGEDANRKYYLMPDRNMLRLGKYVIYLSETLKGDKVLLSRFDLTK